MREQKVKAVTVIGAVECGTKPGSTKPTWKLLEDKMSNKLFLDDQKLDASDDSVSDEEIEAFVRDLNKVAEDNKDKINYIPALEE